MPKTPQTPPTTKSAKPAKSDKSAKSDHSKPRQLKAPIYKSFRLQKRIKPVVTKLPSAFRLFADSLKILGKNWKMFLGIVLVYGVLMVLFVRGLGGGANLNELKSALESSGNFGRLLTGTVLFAYLVGTSGNASSDVAGAYQLILTLMVSLALIWSLRQVYAGNRTRIRDGFYGGMYPLVPFILVLLVSALQLIPLAIGAFLFSTVQSGAIAATGIETLLWGVVFFLLAVVSLYMLASSLFALYIVCLPNMQPMMALRSAKQLVQGRRWTVLRKIIFLPFALLVLAALIMLPIVMLATPIAAWAFFAISMLGLPIIHSYMYGLYRAML